MSHTFSKPVLKTLFILYLMALGYLVFIYQREIDLSWLVKGDLWVNFENKVNLIPFKSILSYVQKMNTISGMNVIIENVIAHIVVFGWLGYFLPRLYEKTQNLAHFLRIILVILVSIELVQFLTQSGLFDIDDILINLVGAYLGFKYLRHIDDIESGENHG
jgi:glycopeptide antibiotics resistance protein